MEYKEEAIIIIIIIIIQLIFLRFYLLQIRVDCGKFSIASQDDAMW